MRPQMSPNLYEFDQLLDQIIAGLEKNGIKMSDAEKETVKENVKGALKEAHPDGIPKSVMNTPEFIKKISLCVTTALAQARNPNDPNLKINLSLIFKDPANIPDKDLKDAFRLLFKQINQLRPVPLPVDQNGLNDQINLQVDTCMKSKDPKATLEKIVEELFLFEQMKNNEANLSGGMTSKGEWRPGAVRQLTGNVLGVAAQGPQYSATSTLADEVLTDPSANPAVQAQVKLRETALSTFDAVVETIADAVNNVCSLTPRPGPPK